MKNKQRTTNNEQRTYRAFTLIELVVSIALLAIVFLFAGVIFKVSINAYRTAAANAEIMQTLRAVTDQLNADLKGTIWSCPAKISFVKDSNDIRSDSLIFFASGDFQSTNQYGSAATVAGNVACLFYALADVTAYTPEEKRDPRKKILMRRQIIMTSDTSLPGSNLNALDEYCTAPSLAEVIANPAFDPNNYNLLDRRLDLSIPADLVNYMAKGVDDFTIQYVGWEYPDQGKQFHEWRPDNSDISGGWPGNLDIYPLAFKFTFTLYDSKGIIKSGRTFTHIVYLGN